MRIIRSAVLAISATLSLIGGVGTIAHAEDGLRFIDSGDADGITYGPIDPELPPDPSGP